MAGVPSSGGVIADSNKMAVARILESFSSLFTLSIKVEAIGGFAIASFKHKLHTIMDVAVTTRNIERFVSGNLDRLADGSLASAGWPR